MTQSDSDSREPSQVPTPSLAEGHIPSTGLVVAGQALLPATAPGWGPSGPSGPEILRNAFDPIWLLHSLRRHWVLATGLGLLVGAIFTAFMWWLLPAQFTAVALLKVAASKPIVAFNVDESIGKEDYDTYRQTQMTYVTSHFVIAAALKQEGIAQLKSVLDARPDPVVWLQDELRVTFPREGELMQISLDLEVREDARQLVDAVVKAYQNEIVYKDQLDRKVVFSKLLLLHQKMTEGITAELNNFKTLAKQLGQSESEVADVNRELALANLSDMRKEREGLLEQKLEAELALKLMKVAGDDEMQLGEAVQAQMESDPKTVYLKQRLFNVEARLTEEKVRAKRADAPSIQRMMDERQQLLQEIARVQAELRRQAQQTLASNPNSEIKSLTKAQKLRKSHYETRIEDLDDKSTKVQEEIRALAEQSAELETKRALIEQLQMVAGDVATRIETWRVELDPDAPHRITVAQPAIIMEGLDWIQRYILIGLGGLFGFGLTCFGVAYWDFGHRRLNGPHQISEGLGIRVIGTLPPLAFHSTGDDSDPMLAVLMESIDSIRTTLMHAHTSRETRVVLVTSAAGHEGRSTVASQLAASLARAGRRTLLVDGDLRHPSLHLLFDFPLEDGFCESLRGDADIADVVRPTHAEGLWLLTAGYCDARAIQALARDQVQPVFDKVRDDYDFVIIDGAPVLNLSDSLIMGQYCDGAILSVLRDVSEVRKVHEANELLRSVGIRIIGSVVNGVREKPDDRVARLLLPAVATTEA